MLARAVPVRQTILVADDDELVRETLENALSTAGYKAYSVGDGAAGISWARAIKPDLMLCDIKLPKVNGFEVVRELRRASETARMPFFLFSGLQHEDVKRASTLVGAEDFIAKPVDIRNLLGRIAGKLGVAADATATRPANYVDLRPAMEVLGKDWSRLRRRALAMAESVIRRELSRGETCVSDDHGFYILQPSLAGERGRDRIEQLQTKIVRHLVGERGFDTPSRGVGMALRSAGRN